MSKVKQFEREWKKSHKGREPGLWEQLEAIERETMIVRPKGSFTIAEYAEARGIKDRNQATHTLYRLARLGKVKRHKAPGSISVYWTLA